MRPVGRVLSPMSDGSHELSQRGYSLHQSQLVGNEKRRSDVTWGSPTRGNAQGDGVAIVVRPCGIEVSASEKRHY